MCNVLKPRYCDTLSQDALKVATWYLSDSLSRPAGVRGAGPVGHTWSVFSG